MNTITKLLLTFLLGLAVVGCAGTRTFHEAAFAGDTILIAAGWKHNISPDNIKVTITPSSGPDIKYFPGNPAIRAMTNMVVDPLSSIVISRQTGVNQTPHAIAYADTMQNIFTGDDRDWWQTVIFLDLPDPLPEGITTIVVDDTGVGGVLTEYSTATVNIIADSGDGGVSTGGTSHNFNAQILGPITPNQMASLRRVDHYTVSFSGGTIPAAIEVDLVHDADVGQTYVVNPIGYIKNAAWSDDGTNLKVILTPTREGEITTMTDYKFYVAGGITGLALAGVPEPVKAYDTLGVPVSGVSVSID